MDKRNLRRQCSLTRKAAPSAKGCVCCNFRAGADLFTARTQNMSSCLSQSKQTSHLICSQPAGALGARCVFADLLSLFAPSHYNVVLSPDAAHRRTRQHEHTQGRRSNFRLVVTRCRRRRVAPASGEGHLFSTTRPCCGSSWISFRFGSRLGRSQQPCAPSPSSHSDQAVLRCHGAICKSRARDARVVV